MINTGFSPERHLIGNAIDAREMIVDGARLLRIRALRNYNNTIHIEIRHLGAGIATLRRVLKRFFTARENSMGKGLAICRSIIESLLIQARHAA